MKGKSVKMVISSAKVSLCYDRQRSFVPYLYATLTDLPLDAEKCTLSKRANGGFLQNLLDIWTLTLTVGKLKRLKRKFLPTFKE